MEFDRWQTWQSLPGRYHSDSNSGGNSNPKSGIGARFEPNAHSALIRHCPTFNTEVMRAVLQEIAWN
jgi:hypothetical protein